MSQRNNNNQCAQCLIANVYCAKMYFNKKIFRTFPIGELVAIQVVFSFSEDKVNLSQGEKDVFLLAMYKTDKDKEFNGVTNKQSRQRNGPQVL